MKKKAFLTSVAGLAIACLFSASPLWAQKKTAKLTDPEIAFVAVTANQIDIDAAKIAQSKSKNADVVNFAKTMIADHQSVINQASALVKKLNVTPKDNALSRQLAANAKKTAAVLKGKTGTAYDRAYVKNEVAYHKAVIATVENTLIPQTSNAELKSLLESVVPVLKTHLGHAQMVEKNLK